MSDSRPRGEVEYWFKTEPLRGVRSSTLQLSHARNTRRNILQDYGCCDLDSSAHTLNEFATHVCVNWRKIELTGTILDCKVRAGELAGRTKP